MLLLDSNYSNAPFEPKCVKWEGEMVKASCFGSLEFEYVCSNIAKMTEANVMRVMVALADTEALCVNDTRRSGEGAIEHPKAVALISMIELKEEDPDVIIANIVHDNWEDYYLSWGNDYSKRRKMYYSKAVPVRKTFDVFRFRYGEKVAKIVEALTFFGDPMDYVDYKKAKSRRVINCHPEVMKEAASGKVVDVVHNIRTDVGRVRDGELKVNEGRLANRFLGMMRYILPLARVAGEKYWKLLNDELQAKMYLLSPEQKAKAQEVDLGIKQK